MISIHINYRLNKLIYSLNIQDHTSKYGMDMNLHISQNSLRRDKPLNTYHQVQISSYHI